MKIPFLLPAVLALASILCGCTGPRAVVFVTGTQLGIEVNAVEGGQQTAHVGYRRAEAVRMPLSVEHVVVDEIIKTNATNTTTTYRTNKSYVVLTNAYPVVSSFEMTSGSLFIPSGSLATTGSGAPLRINQVFATGDAAVIASMHKTVQKDFKALTQRIATDDSSMKLRRWANDADNATFVSRRAKISAWIEKQHLGIHVTNFIYDTPFEKSRVEFIKEQEAAGERF